MIFPYVIVINSPIYQTHIINIKYSKSYGLKVPAHFNRYIVFIFALGKQKSNSGSTSKTHKLKNIEETVLSNLQNTAIVESVRNEGALAYAAENKAVDNEEGDNEPQVEVKDKKTKNNEVTNKRNQRMMKARAWSN